MSATPDPTERSMPPVRMTAVIPTPRMPITDTESAMFRRLAREKKAPKKALIAHTHRRSCGHHQRRGPLGRSGVASELADELSLAHDEQSIRQRQGLSQLRRDGQPRGPSCRELPQAVIDLGAGADVHAACGLVQDQDFEGAV